MDISIRICDVCHDKSRPTKRYEVREGNRTKHTDRCAVHGEVFEAVLSPGRRTRPRSRRTATVTMEEIEAMKRGA